MERLGSRDRGVIVLGDELREPPWRLCTLASVDQNPQYRKDPEVSLGRHLSEDDWARLAKAFAPTPYPAKPHNNCLRDAYERQIHYKTGALVELVQHADDSEGLEAYMWNVGTPRAFLAGAH